MGSRKIASDDISFVTDINPGDKEVFKKIMNGMETEGAKVQDLLMKFFKK